MDLLKFRDRVKSYKLAKGQNPLLNYWDWKRYAEGGEVKEWNPNITGEGYDDKGYYAQAMNPLPEIQVYGNKNIDKSEINRTHTDVPYYNYRFDNTNVQPGRGALEIVSPEFDLISGVRGIANSIIPKLKIKNISKDLDFNISKFKLKSDPLKETSVPISNKIKFENVKGLSGNINNVKYLDYGDIPFGYNIGEETPQYIKNIKNFYNDDVNYREHLLNLKYNNFNIGRSYDTFGNTKVNVRKYLDDVDYYGYADKDGIVISKNNDMAPDEILVHEGTHTDLFLNINKNFDKLDSSEKINRKLSNNNNSDLAYSKENTNLLQDAYNFDDLFLEKNYVDLLLEKGATNRENRYMISKQNNNVTKKELDKVINNMTDDEIGYMMMQGNAYSKSFWKDILLKNKLKSESVKKIKKALIGVPSLMYTYLNLNNKLKNQNNE